MADNETPAETPTETTTPGTIADTPLLEEVAVGSARVTGAVFVAPTSVALPTDAVTALDPDYKMLSFTGDGGVTIVESSTKKEVRVWEEQALARVVMSGRVEQAKFKPVNVNARVAELMWGEDAVDVDDTTGALSIAHHGNPVPPVHMVIEAVPWDGAVQRLCFKPQVTEKGDMTLNGQDPEGRDLTLDCLALPDGKTMHEYIAYTS